MRMLIFLRLVNLLGDLVGRRRRNWVEISVTRAWSYDMNPRLFDFGDS